MTSKEDISRTIHDLLAARGPGKSICPSEVARQLAPESWRALMPLVRETASALSEAGEVIVTQKGSVVDPVAARGPIRLSRSSGDG